jgi:hypothetical protein
MYRAPQSGSRVLSAATKIFTHVMVTLLGYFLEVDVFTKL